MGFYNFVNLDKYGRFRRRLIYNPDNESFSYPTRGLGPMIAVSRFKYEYEGSLPPALTEIKGQKYIVPSWTKVRPETTLKDIEWIKPKVEEKSKPIFKTYTSGSTGEEYKVTHYPDTDQTYCNCIGYKIHRKCKHITEFKSDNTI